MKNCSILIGSQRFTTAILLGLATLSPLGAQAGDEKGVYQALHYIPCSEYAKDRKDKPGKGKNALDTVYVSGWLSAYNYLTPNTYDILPHHNVDEVMDWLDKFCKLAPNKGLEAGLLQLTSELYPDRVQSMPAAPDKAPGKAADKPSKDNPASKK